MQGTSTLEQQSRCFLLPNSNGHNGPLIKYHNTIKQNNTTLSIKSYELETTTSNYNQNDEITRRKQPPLA
jgi:hypothetical protein